MDDMFRPLRRYADFSGRASRREYWLYMLFAVVLVFGVLFGGMLVGGWIAPSADMFDGRSGGSSLLFGIAGLLILGLIVPSFAVQVRRFHDQDMSGWFVLLNFIPYIGRLILLFFMIRRGTDGENRFGPDPLHPDDGVAEIFA
jgi:uncharacterized membrane protein YhaH (DUF805 family)